MIPGLELIKKIHAGADDTCYSSILTTWKKNRDMNDWKS